MSNGNNHAAVENLGDRIAEDDLIPFMIAFQYHGTGDLASNKKDSFDTFFHPISLKERKYETGISRHKIIDRIA